MTSIHFELAEVQDAHGSKYALVYAEPGQFPVYFVEDYGIGSQIFRVNRVLEGMRLLGIQPKSTGASIDPFLGCLSLQQRFYMYYCVATDRHLNRPEERELNLVKELQYEKLGHAVTY